ncbi:MAG: hypothetical protein KJZ83_10675 [Burkholderiaceae bacterium]|nr:hypothetical protein [Burkholderiaceae bacterium]
MILTGGDVVFQPRKVQRSGPWDAVADRVLINIRKEQMPDAVQLHCPARHCVMVDDRRHDLTRAADSFRPVVAAAPERIALHASAS